MLFFGKSRSQMEVLAAEFMPYEQQLYIIVADGHCDIHVLQFDPERTSPPPSLPPPNLTPLLTPSSQIPNPSPANASSTNQPSTPATSPQA